jgi:hypothetical protein
VNADPFGTDRHRQATLQTWRSSPTRFREDANAEEDLVLGGYRDRWFVELAQNAADAAARAGVPGELRVTLDGRELRVSNTGAPLDAVGVASLASLRASDKRSFGQDGTAGQDGTVGRFGVGFAAVLAISEEPSVASRTGGVAFSAARTRELVDAEPALRAEAELRGGRVPVLRLVWPAAADPLGYDTIVRLPLLPDVDAAALLDAAAAQATDLLLALPALRLVDIAGRRYERADLDAVVGEAATVLLTGPDGAVRWRLARRHGWLAPELVAAADERHRPRWSVCWAVPVSDAGVPLSLPSHEVLHAPTPTDERLSLPARLLASLPVEPSRRRLRPGPATRFVLGRAVDAYPDLVRSLPSLHRPALVPAAGFPRSDVDATLRDGVVEAMRAATWLPAASLPSEPIEARELSPAKACVLDPVAPALVELLADLVPGLVAAELSAPEYAPALVVLDVPRVAIADVVAAVTGVRREPSWWRRLYDALAPIADVDPVARESMAALPVPLTDGRTVTGPRTTVLVEDPPAGLTSLRVVHPQAMHPLLTRLGARRAGPRELLEDDALREAVERSVDDADAGMDTTELAHTALTLVAASGATAPWLGALALPSSTGEARRADELVLPDGALRAVLADDAPLGVLRADVAQAWPRAALRAVGVLDGFAVVQDDEPTGPDHDLADEEQWWDGLDAPPARLMAVRDLDLVADDAWPAALRLLASEPETARALRDPYTRWWLAGNALLAGRAPRHWRLETAVELAGLYDPVPHDLGLTDALLVAAGVRTALTVVDADDADDLLRRLADADREPAPATVFAAHAALAGAAIDPDELTPPTLVRAVTGEVVHPADAYVLDAPWLWAIADPDCLVAGGDPAALADLLDLPTASDELSATVVSTGRLVAWSALPEVAAVCQALGRPVPSGELWMHDALRVRTPDEVDHTVPWWVDGAVVHAADPVRALLHLPA